MKRVSILTILLAAIFFDPALASAAALKADDFLPPVQANTPEQKTEVTTIKQPEAVKQEKGLDNKPATVAATAQDATNAVIKHLPAAGGCEQIIFPSGLGWVSTGVSSYTVLPNPTATLSGQRIAYQKAYMQAKKGLAEALYGLSTIAKEKLFEEMQAIVRENDSVANTASITTESIEENVKGLLRGYVVYDIKDTMEKEMGTVSVTIVTTPKTCGAFGRISPDSLSAESIRDGLNHVLTELSNGLMPPVGGKTISVPQTGELAFIGFGTAVVIRNPNPAVQSKMTLEAQKMATMRARSALCGIILGDEISANKTTDSATVDMSTQFEEINKEDPTNPDKNSIEYKKLAEQKTAFLNTFITKEEITSIRKGVLPPGVSVKTFFNEEKTLAEAVAIYLPSVTASADKMRKTMQNSQIIQQNSSGGSGATGGPSGAQPKQGPSGKVMNDTDL